MWYIISYMFKKCLFFTFMFAFFLVPHLLTNQKADALFLNVGGRVNYTFYCLNGVIFWSLLPLTQSFIPYFAPYITAYPKSPFIPPTIGLKVKGKASPLPLTLCAIPSPPFVLPLPVFPVFYFGQSA